MKNKLLIAIFFALPLVYWSGFFEPAATTRWIMLSAMLPVVWLFSPRTRMTTAHWFFAVWLGWAALTSLWAISPYESAYYLWHFLVLGVAFWIGATLDRQTFRACIYFFAIATAINGGMALWQEGTAVGLFGQKNQMAAAAAMALAALMVFRWRWLVLLVLPALLLPLSKAAFVALWLVSIKYLQTQRQKNLIALAGVFVLVIVTQTLQVKGSLDTRIALYTNSLSMVTIQGKGIGSFWAEYPAYAKAVIPSPVSLINAKMRPHTAHNDVLTVVVETGVIGLLLALGFIVHVMNTRHRDEESRAAKAAIYTFFALGLFSFPLFVPTTGALFALAAGFLVRPSDFYSRGSGSGGERADEGGPPVPLRAPDGSGADSRTGLLHLPAVISHTRRASAVDRPLG